MPPEEGDPTGSETVVGDDSATGGLDDEAIVIDAEAPGLGAGDDALDLEDTSQTGPPAETLTRTIFAEPYDPDKVRDHARRAIAYWLLAILSGIVVMSFVVFAWALNPYDSQGNYERLVGLLQILFGPIITLVGSATGFYFGAQAANAQQSKGGNRGEAGI